jgi:thiol-disulfide isomerase/thioredoxin
MSRNVALGTRKVLSGGMKTLRAGFACFVLGALGTGLSAAETWMDNLEAAQARAAKEHNGLLLEFTGSAWCPPCIALHKQVLTGAEFATFSQNLVLVALDYPVLSERTPEKIRAKPALARLMAIKEKYDAPGFPTMIRFGPDGKEVARVVGYDGGGAKAYLAQLQPKAR